ncbi:DegT/DnrJ/EryC1/StrS family aminotransferase [Candidatus Bathyarchaeota archaeon]|nr:DegT/DnrJ/EryC1/StrS family aminotransferase [Candidatus Bathyarchaeota archaeon]
MINMSPFNMFTEDDLEKVKQFLKTRDISGWFGNNDGGPYLKEFQRSFSEYLGAEYAFAVSSGSASIYLALKALDVGRGDLVAVPAYTHIGSVAPIVLAQAKPVFIDVDEYGNMNPPDLRYSIENGPTPKAVIVVHQLGLPCDMDAIRKAAPFSSFVEDASHALGAKYRFQVGAKYRYQGKPPWNVGTIGDIGCFSVGGGRTKTIGTGEGGMVVTGNEKLAEKIKNLRNHGDRSFNANYHCFNFRMSDLNALIGLLQMPKLDTFNSWQIKNAEYLIQHLPPCLQVPDLPSNVLSTRYLVGTIYSPKIGEPTRDQLLQGIRDRGFIGGEPRRNIGLGYSKLISDVRFYKRFKTEDLPMSDKLIKQAVWFDWHRYPRTKEDIDEMLQIVNQVLEGKKDD